MTIPSERLRAFKNARRFLLDLLDRKKTPRVPLWIRREARYALKHFAHDYELEKISQACPDLLIDKPIKGNKV